MNQHNPQPNLEKIVSTYSDDPEIHEIVVDFVNEMPKRIQQANNALQRGDTLRLQFWAHEMKGTAGGYGFLQISKSAEFLEEAINNKRGREAISKALLAVVDLCSRCSAT